MAKKMKMLKGVKLNTKGMERNRFICAALEGILANQAYFGKSAEEISLIVMDHVVALEKTLANEAKVIEAKKQAEKEQKAKEKAEAKERKRIEKGFKKASGGFDHHNEPM